MLIRSGDIRDQSRKLSEIAANVGRLFRPRKFLRAGLRKVVGILSPQVTVRRLEKFRENTPTGPEVIRANTLNFRPDF